LLSPGLSPRGKRVSGGGKGWVDEDLATETPVKAGIQPKNGIKTWTIPFGADNGPCTLGTIPFGAEGTPCTIERV
jgi:hypothetical protein